MTTDDILYQAGLTAQGCWDELDGYAQAAILLAIKMTREAEQKRCCGLIFGHCGSDNVAQRTVDAIKRSGE